MGIDLINEIETKTGLLNTSIETLRSRGKAFAEAEAEYRVNLATKISELRSQGIPVTIINDLARGDKKIAELRVKRDIAEVYYNSTIEFIQATKIQIKILDNQISREWGK